MKRDELLKLCHFYNSEDECPQEFDGRIEGKLWAFENTACEIMDYAIFTTAKMNARKNLTDESKENCGLLKIPRVK